MTAPTPTRTIDPVAELTAAHARQGEASDNLADVHARLMHELQSLPGSEKAQALLTELEDHAEAYALACSDSLHVLLAWVRHLGAKGV